MEIKKPSKQVLQNFLDLFSTHLHFLETVECIISPKDIANIVIDYLGTLDDALAVLDGYPLKSIVLYYVRPKTIPNPLEFALAIQSIGKTKQELDKISLINLIHSLI